MLEDSGVTFRRADLNVDGTTDIIDAVTSRVQMFSSPRNQAILALSGSGAGVNDRMTCGSARLTASA